MIAAFLKQDYYWIATVSTVAIVFLPSIFLIKHWIKVRSPSHQLAELVTVIFSCLMTPEYPNNIYLFERRVHKQKLKCLRQLQCLSRRAINSDVLALFEIIVDIGQVRRRVTDYTTFALCEVELHQLKNAMVVLIRAYQYGAPNEQKLEGLAYAIDYFEDVFEHVVKVAAREPVVFILFINGLRELLRRLRASVTTCVDEQIEAPV